MESNSGIKCPRCGNNHTIVHKRGFSFLQGLVVGVALVIIDFVYTLVINIDVYPTLNEDAQIGFAFGLVLKELIIFLFGCLFGLIGKNRLVARCLKCKSKFDPSKGI